MRFLIAAILTAAMFAGAVAITFLAVDRFGAASAGGIGIAAVSLAVTYGFGTFCALIYAK